MHGDASLLRRSTEELGLAPSAVEDWYRRRFRLAKYGLKTQTTVLWL